MVWFCWHTWTPWEQYKKVLTYDEIRKQSIESRQRRRCVKCGYEQDEYVASGLYDCAAPSRDEH